MERNITRWLPSSARIDAAKPPQTDAELADYLAQRFGVRLPDTCVCPQHTTPFRAFADAYFARAPVAIWKASRGFGGKTFILALLGLVEAITLGADVTVLGGSGEQSARVHEYMNRWWSLDTAPVDLLDDDPTRRETRLENGGRLRALMASSRSVRGPHPQRLRCDEIDEMKLDILDAAFGQPMATPAVAKQTTLSSTHQYANGTMTEMLSRAAAKGYRVYEWCWRETVQPHGWLSPAEVESKRDEVTAGMWNTEYELQEPSPEGRAIQPDRVAAMFDRALGEFAGAEKEYIEIEPPQPGARYVHGADWARKVDWTIIVTLRLDVFPYRLVAFERLGRRPWPDMIARLDDRVHRFGGMAFYDQTGVGDVVAGYLTVPAQGVMMVGRPRQEMLTSYISGIERGMIKSPFIRFAEAEHRYASVRDVYGSAGEMNAAETAHHLPDTIAAGALAWLGAPKQYTSGADAWLAAYAKDAQGGEPGATDPLAHHPLGTPPGWMPPQRLG